MLPYAIDEAHRLRCLAALGIEASILRPAIYSLAVKNRLSSTAELPIQAGPTSIAAVRQLVVADIENGSRSRVVKVVSRESVSTPETSSITSLAVDVAPPALDNFTLVSMSAGLHWFGVFSGEQTSTDFKAQRALFQSICQQFGERPSVDMHAEFSTVFRWPPLKPAILGLLGGVDSLSMYDRCIVERLPGLVAERASAEQSTARITLLFCADLGEPESGSALSTKAYDHGLNWQKILSMPTETLSCADRLAERLTSNIVFLPSLSRLLTDVPLRRSVQTVLLLLSRHLRPSRN